MYARFQDRALFPSESDSETMLKVLKWGVVPLNLKGHGMNPHSLCWARTNSPEFIRRFNYSWLTGLRVVCDCRGFFSSHPPLLIFAFSCH